MKRLIYTALIVLTACTSKTEQKVFETTLWYDTPAQAWVEALPIGNSHLGGMVYGGTVSEEIQLNEETFWAGGPGEVNNEDALRTLPEARKLIFNDDLAKATDVINDNFFSKSHGMRFLTLGSLHIDMVASENDTVTGYRRELDLGEAIQKTEYTAGDVKFERTAVASIADNVIAVKMTSSEPAGFELSHCSPLPSISKVEDGALVFICDGVEQEGIPAALKAYCRV